MGKSKGIYLGGSLLSILLSLYLYRSGRRETAIFVGLWTPTVLTLVQTLLEDYGGNASAKRRTWWSRFSDPYPPNLRLRISDSWPPAIRRLMAAFSNPYPPNLRSRISNPFPPT